MASAPPNPCNPPTDFDGSTPCGGASQNFSELSRGASPVTSNSLLRTGLAMLHEALRLIRIFHDMSQVELARKMSVAKSYLSEIESGKKQPTLQLLRQYADEFKLPLSSILFFSEALETNSFSERTRLKVSQKVISLLNFIAERSGKISCGEKTNGTSH